MVNNRSNKTTLKSLKNSDLDQSTSKYEEFRILVDIKNAVSSYQADIALIFDSEQMVLKYI